MPSVKILSYLFSSLVFAFLLCSCVESDPEALDPASLGKWEYITTADGLAGNTITDLYVDNDDNFWIGTTSGLSLYDGNGFTNFTEGNELISNQINVIFHNSFDQILVGTDAGLSFYSEGEWFFISEIDGYSFQVQDIIEPEDGEYWFGTVNLGIIILSGQQYFQIFDDDCLECNDINTFYIDSEKNIWVGSVADLKKIDGNSITSYTTRDGLAGNEVYSIFEDNRGDLWVGSADSKNIARYSNDKFESIPLNNGFSNNIITSIIQLNNGNMWIGTVIMGLINYDGLVMNTLFTTDGLPDNTIRDMIKDSNGNIWVGTEQAGIGKYITE